MPIDGVNSGIVEASEKISYTLKLDKKPEIDPDTGGSIQKPMIFSDSFMDDPQNYGYLKLSREQRKNIVNVSNFEKTQMLSSSLYRDTLYSSKIGFRVNKHWIPDSISHCVSSHVSSQFKTNFQDISVIRNHAFVRLMKTFKGFQVTSSVEAGDVKAIGNKLLVNDAFYQKNFKGISNVGQ